MKMKTDNSTLFLMYHKFFCFYLPISRKASPKTVSTYKAALNQFRIYLSVANGIKFADMDFDCFSREKVYEFLVYLRDERSLSVNTLNNRLAAIRSFLEFCSDEDISLSSYLADVQKIHSFKGVKSSKVEYLTETQLKFLYTLPDIHTRIGRRNRFIMIFLYETGARVNELLSLKLCDIIPSDGRNILRITGKGSKTRYVPIMEDAQAHLDAYLDEFHKEKYPDSLLFYTTHQNKPTPMTAANVDRMLKKHASLAADVDHGFPKQLHAHMFRHSVAMAMYKKGIPLSYIKDFLGHESYETVQIYAYADSQTIADALSMIDHETKTAEENKMKWKGREDELLKYCGLK